jgi:phage tail P2-like protein
VPEFTPPQQLLPPNRTTLEAALAGASQLALSTGALRHLWSALHALTPLLPWLSWTLSVEAWHEARSDEARRNLILTSIEVHQRKGTPWAIRLLIRALGFGEVTIIERVGGLTYNGSARYDGEYPHKPLGDTWATYKIALQRPITNVQADRLRRLLPSVAPARCHLVGLRYSAAPNSYNGASRYDGAYNHGSA